MSRTAPDLERARRRRRLYLVGLVPSLLLLLVSVRIVVLLQHESRAMSAYADGRYHDARDHFAANRVLNPLQRWIAPFGEGDASFRLQDHVGAVRAFEAALPHAPGEHECMVRVNLALTHEAHAEALADESSAVEATEARLRGRAVLRGCERLDDLPPEELEVVDGLPEVRQHLPPSVAELTADELAGLTSDQLAVLLGELLLRLRDDDDTRARARLAAALVDLRLARSLGTAQPDRARPPQEPPPEAEVTQEKRQRVEENGRRALEDRVRHQEQFDVDAPPPTPTPSPTPQW